MVIYLYYIILYILYYTVILYMVMPVFFLFPVVLHEGMVMNGISLWCPWKILSWISNCQMWWNQRVYLLVRTVTVCDNLMEHHHFSWENSL